MKNNWTIWLLGIGLLCWGWMRPAHADMPHLGMEHHEGMGAAGHRWGDDLALTDDQKAKLKTLRDSERDTMKPLMRKERDLRIKLKDQVEDKASDAAIQATLNDLKANRKATMEQMKKLQEQKDAILTPTQQAKMMLWRGHHHDMGYEEERCSDHHDWKGHHDHHDRSDEDDNGGPSAMPQ